MSAFLPTTLLGGVGSDNGMNPNGQTKIVIRSRVLRYNYLEGLFHTAKVYKFICPIFRLDKTSLRQGIVLSSLAFNFKCYFILLILIYDKIRLSLAAVCSRGTCKNCSLFLTVPSSFVLHCIRKKGTP